MNNKQVAQRLVKLAREISSGQRKAETDDYKIASLLSRALDAVEKAEDHMSRAMSAFDQKDRRERFDDVTALEEADSVTSLAKEAIEEAIAYFG